MSNPYFNRGMITSKEYFFGRQVEHLRIMNYLHGGEKPQNCSITGPRRIGKSSLLFDVYSSQSSNTRAAAKPIVAAGYYDLEESLSITPPRLLSRLLEKTREGLGFGKFGNASHEVTYDEFTSAIAEMTRNGVTIILFLDEFDSVVTNPNLDSDFFSYLRALTQQYNIAYVLASSNQLKDICHTDPSLKSSKFYNVFGGFINLGLLSEVEAMDIVKIPSERAGASLVEHRDFLISTAGAHPFYLQIACFYLWDMKNQKGEPLSADDYALAMEAFRDETRSHFLHIWEDELDRSEREVLLRIATGSRPELSTALRRQLEAKVILTKEGQLVGRGFGDFILEQKEGVDMQKGTPISARKRVFVSYARPDATTARQLTTDLRRAGFDVWFDKDSLLPGKHWRDEIRNAIRTCDYFIALLSTRSVNKRGVVQAEIASAIDVLKEFPENQVFLIPARLDDCQVLNSELRELQWVDLFPDWSVGVDKIIQAASAAS